MEHQLKVFESAIRDIMKYPDSDGLQCSIEIGEFWFTAPEVLSIITEELIPAMHLAFNRDPRDGKL